MKSRYVLILMVFLLLAIVPTTLSQDAIILRMMSYDTTDQLTRETGWFDQVLADFEADHPGLTIEVNDLPFPQYLPTLEAMIAGDELPDVFYGHVKAAELGRAGLIIDYRDYVDEEWLARFYPGPLRQATFDEAVYAVPQNAQLFMIFVNPAIMQELGLEDPVTWDDLIEMAPVINEAGYIPLAWGNSAGNVCPDFFLPLVAQYGGDTFALDDLADPELSWDSEPVINALALLERLAQAGVFMPGINGVSEDQATQLWYQGRAALKYGGSWTPGVIAAEAPQELVDFYYIIKNPSLTPDSPHLTGNGSGEFWAIKADSPTTELAVELVQYLMSDDIYGTYITNTQSLPSMGWASEHVENSFVIEMTDWLATDGANHILFGTGSWDAVSGVCAAILDGSTTPEEGAATIQANVLAARER
jgi:raffinose/stachyose/melibiose transport system substrate-binding protein